MHQRVTTVAPATYKAHCTQAALVSCLALPVHEALALQWTVHYQTQPAKAHVALLLSSPGIVRPKSCR